MTAHHLRIELVKKSFEKVQENKDSFTLTFYDQLFIESPQLKPLFENTNIPKQSEKAIWVKLILKMQKVAAHNYLI